MAEPQPLTALFYDKHYDKEYETKLLQYVQQMEHSNISDYSQVQSPPAYGSCGSPSTGALYTLEQGWARFPHSEPPP
jgi:hypothetical protein